MIKTKQPNIMDSSEDFVFEALSDTESNRQSSEIFYSSIKPESEAEDLEKVRDASTSTSIVHLNVPVSGPSTQGFVVNMINNGTVNFIGNVTVNSLPINEGQATGVNFFNPQQENNFDEPSFNAEQSLSSLSLKESHPVSPPPFMNEKESVKDIADIFESSDTETTTSHSHIEQFSKHIGNDEDIDTSQESFLCGELGLQNKHFFKVKRVGFAQNGLSAANFNECTSGIENLMILVLTTDNCVFGVQYGSGCIKIYPDSEKDCIVDVVNAFKLTRTNDESFIYHGIEQYYIIPAIVGKEIFTGNASPDTFTLSRIYALQWS
ncbi:Uncharacterized protein QTN25_007097 [Entamoeba marina]